MFEELLKLVVKNNLIEQTRSHDQSRFFGRGKAGEIGGDLLMNSNCFGVSLK